MVVTDVPDDRKMNLTSQTIQHSNLSTTVLMNWLWRNYLRPQLPRLTGATVFMAIQGAMLGVLSYLIRPMFDNVFAQKNQDALIFLGLAVLVVFVVRGLSGFTQRVMMTAVGERMKFDLQRDLVGRILALDKRFFEDNPAGDLIQRINNDIGSIQGVWQGLFAPGVRDLISIASLLVVAISIDITWTVIVLAGIPLLALPVLFLQQVTRRFSLRVAKAHASIIVRLEEMLHNIREIKLYRAEKSQERGFVNTAAIVKRTTVRIEATIASVPLLVEFVAGIGFLGLLMVAGYDVIVEERTLGDFMSFFTAIVLLFDPTKRLGNLLSAWQNLKVSLERVFALFQSTPSILDPVTPRHINFEFKSPDVEFDEVYLTLGGQEVIRGLSFSASAGQVTAIVGPSGAGKTSVFNLLARIIDPDNGMIRVGGQDIREIKIAELRSLIAFVAQDSGIFDESIRDNIMFGNQEADDEQFNQAVEVARVADFALTEKDGFDAPCGPRGERLSGGQKQRVAIARAVLRDSPILLLDEPTSALDLESEKLVQEAVFALAKNRTVIVIAHRLSTVQSADKIIFMQKGKLVEEGRHKELMSMNGHYASLYRIQFKEE